MTYCFLQIFFFFLCFFPFYIAEKKKLCVPYYICVFCSHRLEKVETFQLVPQWTQKSPIHQSLTFTCVVMLVFRYSILCGMLTSKDNTGCWYFPAFFAQETNGTTSIYVFWLFICAIHSALLLLKSKWNNETKWLRSTPWAFSLLCFSCLCTALDGSKVVGLFYIAASCIKFSLNVHPVPQKQQINLGSAIVVPHFLVISSSQSETEAIKQQQYWKSKCNTVKKSIFNRVTS